MSNSLNALYAVHVTIYFSLTGYILSCVTLDLIVQMYVLFLTFKLCDTQANVVCVLK